MGKGITNEKALFPDTFLLAWTKKTSNTNENQIQTTKQCQCCAYQNKH